ncbi:PH domain-containing protein [Propionibacteriaceae bacterium Y1923]|uniref:PH domain-containing protein n=1 Tax=Aestuariimicrobium sp. Y1814 TaxID=3418742 RepID=UPI003C152988
MTLDQAHGLPTHELFAPPTEQWVRVSPDLVKVETISVLLGWPPFAVASIIPVAIFAPWWALVLVAVFWVLLIGWRLWVSRRLARSWAYAQRDTDLYVTHGRWFKQLLVVPYGRMQVVEINAGPLLRRYGLASVRMVTASTTAVIPGVNAQEAARLREDLSRLGEAQAAGL